MQVNHHGKAFRRWEFQGEEKVRHQAVFPLRGQVSPKARGGAQGLGTGHPFPPDPGGPGGHGPWGFEAVRLRIGQAVEGDGALFYLAQGRAEGSTDRDSLGQGKA